MMSGLTLGVVAEFFEPDYLWVKYPVVPGSTLTALAKCLSMLRKI
jgi:hypothetical protein